MLRRRLQAAAPDQRISILDGVLPSPELGPHPPVPAKTFNSSAANAKVIHEGHYCDDGCIAGMPKTNLAPIPVLQKSIWFKLYADCSVLDVIYRHISKEAISQKGWLLKCCMYRKRDRQCSWFCYPCSSYLLFLAVLATTTKWHQR